MRSNRKDGTAFVITHEPNPDRKKKVMSIIALAVTRSLGRQGVPVVRIHPNDLDYSLSSRYVTAFARSPNMYDSEEDLVTFLLELAPHYHGERVLIPASDDCAQVLGKYRESLEPAFTVCVGEPDVIERVMNKQNQYEAAEALGIPIPETYFPKSDADFASVLERATNYPYIIKPLVAHRWRLASMKNVSKGRKAILVNSQVELTSAYSSMGDARHEVMIQEVIGGRDEQLMTFLAYFDRNNSPLAYCVRKKLRQEPIDFGYCASTVSCHNQSVVDLAIRLLQGINYSGICGVEFKYDANADQYKLIEINARAVNTIGLASSCGVDIPYIAYRDLIGETVPPVTDWKDDVAWYRIWADFFAARDLRRLNGKPGLREWLWILLQDGGDAIFAGDDLMFSISYYTVAISSEILRKMKQMLGTGSGS